MAETWQVISQRQTEELNAGGTGFHTVWIVTYRITSGPGQGTTGNVKVDAQSYSAAHVRELIEANVSTHADVAAL